MLPSFRSLVSHHPTQEKVKTDSHASVMPLGRMTRISQVLGWCAIITGGVGSFVGEPFDIVKTLAQTNKEKSLPLTGLVKQIYAAFYRGSISSFCRSALMALTSSGMDGNSQVWDLRNGYLLPLIFAFRTIQSAVSTSVSTMNKTLTLSIFCTSQLFCASPFTF
jgi:WD40 repeat protein